MSELVWIGPALALGLAAVRLGLPPMIGYLVGGFVLNVLGLVDPVKLTQIGAVGVTLLLFTIGLKLDARTLLRPMIWAGTTLHLAAVVVVFGVALYWASFAGLAIFEGIDLGTAMLIAFALSFSSTVFAVKTLEDKGELTSRYGRIVIGILVMQDIIAVVFLAASTGKLPTPWALGLVVLWPLRGVLMRLMTSVGHGELMILYGLALAYGAWGLFEVVGVKGDLGALIIGALLAAHPSAAEMSKMLMGFKELLLVGFFLSIGLAGEITVSALVVAFVLAVAVLVKVALYVLVCLRFHKPARTSILASLGLANYSEFGLIVGGIALANGWVSGDWLVVIALALTMTFVVAAPLNAHARKVLVRLEPLAARLETATTLPEDSPIDPGDARIVIIGMSRVGQGAYDTLRSTYGDVVMGVDADPDVVDRHRADGRNVILADATDDDFWARALAGNLEVCLLAMPEFEANLGVAQRVHALTENMGNVFAIADEAAEVDALMEEGLGAAWSIEAEAGARFAEDVIECVGDRLGAADTRAPSPAD